MKNTWTSFWNFVKNHKKTVIVVVIIIIGGFWYYHSTHVAVATTYTVKPVSYGKIQTTVSGTGQLSSSQELAIDPQVSGTVTSINVKNGDTVTKGEVLATLDNTNAYYSLENAKISLAKLETSNPISLANDQNTLTNVQTSLAQQYQSSFSTLSSTYDSLGTVITGLNDLFYGKDASGYFTDTSIGIYGSTAQSYKQAAGLSIDKATDEYNAFQQQYLSANPASTTSVSAALAKELSISQDIVTAVKNTSLAVNYVIGQIPQASRTSAMTNDQNSITSWLSSANSANSSIASAQSSIQSDNQGLTQAQSNLAADQTTNDPLALESAQLSLQEAQTTYDEYTITAPFSGTIGDVTLHVGDSAGPSTPIGTIVTKQYQSDILLNEVNVAKVAVGQPVTVTFNALPNIIATGTVTDVDTVGTVSSGVVSYDVIVSFNTDNPSVKAGMSINATIVTAEEDNVLVVPNSAIKTSGGVSYVQVPAGTVTTASTEAGASGTYARRTGTGSSTRQFGGGYGSTTASTTMASGTPVRNFSGATGTTGGTVTSVTNKVVQIGLSDNTNTEITGGLTPGELVVTQTLTGTSAKTAGSASILNSLGGARTGAAAGGATFTRPAGGGGGFTGGGRGG